MIEFSPGRIVVLCLLLSACARPPAPAPGPALRGVALGLFAADSDYDYGTLLSEIAALGATDVLLSVPWFQRGTGSHDVAPRPGRSPSDSALSRTVRQARAKGLRPAVVPLVLLLSDGAHWRGQIRPSAGTGAWFAAYESHLLHLAEIAEAAGVERLGVGSELVLLEAEEASFRQLIRKVRQRFSGRLFYSANWDHFAALPFWDALDEAAVTGYFELSHSSEPPTLAALLSAWDRPRTQLMALRRRLGMPLFLSEIGYRSTARAAQAPWDDRTAAAPDLALQARLYEAFCGAFAGSAATDGFYLWNWFGFGGPSDTGYTPRGKPAAATLARCLGRPDWDR